MSRPGPAGSGLAPTARPSCARTEGARAPVPIMSAAAVMVRNAMSHLPGPQIRNRERRIPLRCGPRSIALHVNVEQVWPPVGIGAQCTPERSFNTGRVLDALGLDAEGLRCLGDINVGAAVVAGHVASGFGLRAADERPDAVALVVVAHVVENDVGDRRAIASLAPKRLRSTKRERPVAEYGKA